MHWKRLALCALGTAACFAQQYEIGGAAGAGFANNASLSGAVGSATAGLKTGAAFGGWLGHNMYGKISGEVRYAYMRQDLSLTSGSSTSFKGESHAVHYDVLIHPSGRAKVQPFLAAGGGGRYYRGTGKEAAFQPLSNYAYLTKTQEWQPMISAGAGLRMQIAKGVFLRTEVRDYITPFPKKVITPAPGVKASGWLHDIVPMVGIGFGF